MPPSSLTYNDANTNFIRKQNALFSFSFFLICTGSFLATQQLIMELWPHIFFIGVFIFVSTVLLSLIRKIFKKSGLVNSDVRKKKKKKNSKLKGINLKG